MVQALPLLNGNSFFEDNEDLLQNWLDRLSQRKLDWEQFTQKAKDLFAAARLAAVEAGRSLLHLAVLDNRLDVIDLLKSDPSLQLRRDHFGQSPFELAQLLNRKEALTLLQSSRQPASLASWPELGSIEYLSHPVFETQEGLEQVLAMASRAKKEDKISAEKIWMGIYFDKEIRKGMHPPVSIRYIDSEIGWGVFADKKISPCSYVGEYTGVVQERTPQQLKDKRYCLRYTIWDGKKNFAIDAEEKGNFTRFLNHSANPNLGLQSIYWRGIPRMIFVALKEIKEGSQLTFDYGPLFWKEMKMTPKLL